MKLSELPQNQQDVLEGLRDQFKGKITTNNAWCFTAYSEQGTRVFSAARQCIGYVNPETGYERGFGGGNYWVISYRSVCWKRSYRTDPLGGKELWLGWTRNGSFSRVVNEQGETLLEIPKTVGSKKEVIELYKALTKVRKCFPKWDSKVVSTPLTLEKMAEYQDVDGKKYPVSK